MTRREFMVCLPIIVSCVIGIASSAWIKLHQRMPRNGFSSIVSFMTSLDLLMTSFTLIQHCFDFTLRSCGGLPDWKSPLKAYIPLFLKCFNLAFQKMYLIMGLSIALISIYLVRFSGSMEKVYAKLIFLVTGLLGIFCFFYHLIVVSQMDNNNHRKIIFFSQYVVIGFLLLVSIFAFILTWIDLKILQVKRRKNYANHPTLAFNSMEESFHQGSLMMMSFSARFCTANTIAWLPTVIWGLLVHSKITTVKQYGIYFDFYPIDETHIYIAFIVAQFTFNAKGFMFFIWLYFYNPSLKQPELAEGLQYNQTSHDRTLSNIMVSVHPMSFINLKDRTINSQQDFRISSVEDLKNGNVKSMNRNRSWLA
ncbi:hypothetical protein BC833DRAFT_594599 [Globomyces pollinis-pini]|nr:hypothetical protein BC833DRAFT_594599 [Globomyces pollinis-pini]